MWKRVQLKAASELLRHGDHLPVFDGSREENRAWHQRPKSESHPVIDPEVRRSLEVTDLEPNYLRDANNPLESPEEHKRGNNY